MSSDRTVRLHRVLRCKPEKVYRAFTEAVALAKWLPPYGFTCTVHELAARVGGTFRMSFHNFSSGNGHSFGGEYLELVPFERLRYTDRFDDPNLPGVIEVTVVLTPVLVGTELHVTQAGIPDAIPLEMCVLGWQESLAQLATLVEPEIPRLTSPMPIPTLATDPPLRGSAAAPGEPVAAPSSAVAAELEPDVVAGAPPPLAELWRDFSRNRGAVIGLVVVVLLVLCALLADVIAPYSPSEQYRDATLHAPSWQPIGGHRFVLGTDPVGRDVLSRLLHGTRLSLLIGFVSVGLSLTGGVLLGLVAGFFRGATEFAVMRLMDIMLALPSLLLAVAVVAVLGPGLTNAMVAIAIVMLPHFVRLTRAAVIGETGKDYVAASRLAGAGTARLMFDAVLPNCAAPLIVQATLGFSTAILDAAALGFLGLGAQPPTPEWGSMLASALEFIQSAWWVVTLPGLAILVTVLAFNLMGDGLRDALDPRLKR